MYPEAQRKAQSELDRVVGSNRLPEFDDRPSLPYVAALLKEVSRWHVGTPIGLPHRTTADDNYNGYFIPGGTIVLPNIWYVLFCSLVMLLTLVLTCSIIRAYAHDPEAFPEPEEFRPERFLNAKGELDLSKGDPASFVFGFGRRSVLSLYCALSQSLY